MNTRITPTLARKWLADETLIPAEWLPLFSMQKRRKLIVALSLGFYMEGKSGCSLGDTFTVKQFFWAKRAANVRVVRLNTEKTKAKEMLSRLKDKKKLTLTESMLVEQLRAHIGDLHDFTYTYMDEVAYRRFYGRNKHHAVEMCNPKFWDEFPNALKTLEA